MYRDYYVPITKRASEVELSCVRCESPVPLEWIPQVGAMDAKEPFQQSTVYVRQPDGSEKPTVISSLSQMRAIERDSEQRQKDGEGQQMVWRSYSQDRGNDDRHSFAQDPSVAPVKSSRISVKAVDADVGESASYGPGVSDANTSALVSE